MKTPSPLHRTSARGRRPGSRRGFSLIEVMIALVVFAIGVLSLGLVVPLATRKVERAGQQTRASSLAAQQAEQLLMTPFGDPTLTVGTHTNAGNPVSGIYYVSWAVRDSTPVTGCKRVTVSVARYGVNNPAEAQLVIIVPQSNG